MISFASLPPFIFPPTDRLREENLPPQISPRMFEYLENSRCLAPAYVVKCLFAFQKDPRAVAKILTILVWTVMDNDENKVLLAQLNAIGLVVRVLNELGTRNESIALAGCEFLCELGSGFGCEERCERIVQESVKGYTTIIRILRHFGREDPKIVKYAAWALLNLTFGNEANIERNCQIIFNHGCVDAVVNYLRYGTHNPEAEYYSFWLLGNLCCSVELACDRLLELHGVQCVVNSLRHYRDNQVDVTKWGCWVIMRLAFGKSTNDETRRDKIMETGIDVHEVIIHALQYFGTNNQDVTLYASWALYNLSCGPGQGQTHRCRQILQENGIEALIQGLDTFENNEEIAKYGIAALVNLSNDTTEVEVKVKQNPHVCEIVNRGFTNIGDLVDESKISSFREKLNKLA